MDRNLMLSIYRLTKHCVEQDELLRQYGQDDFAYEEDAYKNHTGMVLMEIGIDLLEPKHFDEKKREIFAKIVSLFSEL